MKTEPCRLCRLNKPLCNSHALPDSLFKYILRKNSGKAIVVNSDKNTPVHYSSDTWSDKLLCNSCEAKLNASFDDYGMKVFRGHKGSIVPENLGVNIVGVDASRLRMFFLSILWRVSISRHNSYKNIDLPYAWEEDLRLALEIGRKIPESRYHVALFKLHDPTPQGGFNNEALRSFISAPFARRARDFVAICFPFLGFYIEIYMPKLPKKYSNRPGILHRGTVHFAPYMDALEIPEIMEIMVNGLRKHEDGLSKVG